MPELLLRAEFRLCLRRVSLETKIRSLEVKRDTVDFYKKMPPSCLRAACEAALKSEARGINLLRHKPTVTHEMLPASEPFHGLSRRHTGACSYKNCVPVVDTCRAVSENVREDVRETYNRTIFARQGSSDLFIQFEQH